MHASTTHLALPFFDDVHRELGPRLAVWICAQQVDESDDRKACREWVKRLGDSGWLRYCVPAGSEGALGGALDKLDSRALVILRETLAFHSPLADFAFVRAAIIAASFTIFARSAPDEPAVLAAKASRLTDSSNGLFLE